MGPERRTGDRFTRLLYVGRLAEDKDPLTAIRAMKLLPERFTLSIYGRGDANYVERLKKETETLSGRVEFRSLASKRWAGYTPIVAADTMDIWIKTAQPELLKLLPRIDLLMLSRRRPAS